MSRPHISLAVLMVLVAVVGIGIAALRDATELWASVLFTLTLGLLGIVALGAAFGKGHRRVFYAGFAAFGFGYMALCFGPWASTEIRPNLATTKLLDYGVRHLHSTPQIATLLHVWDIWTVDKDRDGQPDAAGVTGTRLAPPMTSLETFQRVGHSLFALLIALIGGIAARLFAARDDLPRPCVSIRHSRSR